MVFMLMFGFGSSLLVVWVRLGLGMGVFLRVARLARFLSWLSIFLGVGLWSLFLVVRRQLYADNLKCVSGSPAALLSAVIFTSMYIRLVGQEAAPPKCVFLCTSMKIRNDMKCWAVSDSGDKWSARLHVRDLGGHLDSTMHLPAALHGVEASLVSISGLRRLRTAFGQAAMSGSLQPWCCFDPS